MNLLVKIALILVILARLARVGDIAGQMGQAGLLRIRMALLGRVATAKPERDAPPSRRGPRWRRGSAPPDGRRPPRSGTHSDRRSRSRCALPVSSEATIAARRSAATAASRPARK